MRGNQPLIKVIPASKVTPFVTIVKNLQQQHGSLSKVAVLIGVSETVIAKLINEFFLTDKQARKILAYVKNSRSLKV